MNIYQKLSEGNFPDFGSTCHVIRTHGDKQEEFFGRAKNAYGVPAWQTAQGIIVDAMPSDQWKLVEFEASPKTQAEPPADQPEQPTAISMPFSPRGYSEIVIGDVTVRQYNDGRTEALYNGKVMVKGSTEAMTLTCNEAQPPADTEKIKFRVEDGMLVGENTDAEWCVATPVNEAYDALLDYSRLVAISSQTPVSNTVPVSNNLRPLPKDFANNAGIAASTPAPNNMSWSQEFETRDLHIKALENLIGRQVETINESDSIIKKHKESINSLHQLIATKNAELDSLRIKNMELTARLNQS